jgi:DNA-binding MarR family transcriptional regulator
MVKTLKEQIIELRNRGYTYKEIKKTLGCSIGTVSYHLGVGQKEKTISKKRDKRNQIRKYIQQYKAGKCCSDCGENYPYWILEFDHLGDKSFTIGQFSKTTTDLELIKTEITKCDVVCANCHKNRSFNRLLKDGNGVDWDNCKYEE